MASLTNYKKDIDFTKLYYNFIIIFAFTLPLSRAAISFFIVMLPILWIIEGGFKEKFSKIKDSHVLKAVLLYLIVLLITATYSVNLEETWHIIRMHLYWLAIFVIATSIEYKNIKIVFTAFLFGMLVSEIITYGVFFEFWAFKDATPQNPTPFMNHSNYSIFLAFTSSLLLYRLFSKEYLLYHKVLLFLFFLSTTGSLFLIAGRTGQIMYILSIFCLFLLVSQSKLKAILTFLIISAAIYAGAYNLSSTFKNRMLQSKESVLKVIENQDFNSSLGVRASLWHVTFEIFKDNPLLGVGIGDHKDALRQTIQSPQFQDLQYDHEQIINLQHAHSQFLTVAVQAGIMGIAALLYLVVQSFLTALNVSSQEYRVILTLFLIIFFAAALTALTPWYRQFSSSFWVLFIGLLAALEINKKQPRHGTDS